MIGHLYDALVASVVLGYLRGIHAAANPAHWLFLSRASGCGIYIFWLWQPAQVGFVAKRRRDQLGSVLTASRPMNHRQREAETEATAAVVAEVIRPAITAAGRASSLGFEAP